jgi:hypothetical protein
MKRLTVLQDAIARTNQSKLGYEKYTTRKDGMANNTVIKQYRASTKVLKGSTYTTMNRNNRTRGILAVNCKREAITRVPDRCQ